MACYHPLKGFPYGETAKGRTNFIITSAGVDHIEIDDKGNIRKATSRGISDNTKLCISGAEAIDIPCGQCIGCRLAYSSEWASRCLLEMMKYDDNCFITLTYDEVHIKNSWFCKLSNHKEYIVETLDKKDFQLFWKRLRKKTGKKIRYYLAGEYGDSTARPHGHAIIFGYDPRNDPYFDDWEVVGSSDLGYTYYSSDKFNDIWSNGHVVVADASWETAAYTARYVMKKIKGIGRSFYDEMCLQPEFVAMSRKPGIGLDWFNENKKCYAIFLREYLRSNNGMREIGKIRYFDEKLDEMYPFDYEKIKADRKEFEQFRKKLKLQQTSLSYAELLDLEESASSDKTRIFKRISI